MTRRQIAHGLKLADDLRRAANEKRPGAVVVLRTTLKEFHRALRRCNASRDCAIADLARGEAASTHNNK